jgi:hypothetical protein
MSNTRTEILPDPDVTRSTQRTDYLILRETEPDRYELVGRTTAVNALEAVRKLATEQALEGSFVAVPARSWKIKTVVVEQEPRIRVT